MQFFNVKRVRRENKREPRLYLSLTPMVQCGTCIHPYALQCMPYNINIRNSNRKLFTGKIKPGQIKPLKTKTTLKTFLTFSVSVAHVECTQKVRFLVSKYLDINSQGACFKICKARILH